MLRNVGSYFLMNVLIQILTFDSRDHHNSGFLDLSFMIGFRKMRWYLLGSLNFSYWVCLESDVGNRFVFVCVFFCIQYLLKN